MNQQDKIPRHSTSPNAGSLAKSQVKMSQSKIKKNQMMMEVIDGDPDQLLPGQ
jgi:hypothetical protein